MTLGTMITARSCAKYAGGHLIAWSSNVKSMDVAKQDEILPVLGLVPWYVRCSAT